MKGGWEEEGDIYDPNRNFIQMPSWKCVRVHGWGRFCSGTSKLPGTDRIWPSARADGICRDVPVDVPIQNLHFHFHILLFFFADSNSILLGKSRLVQNTVILWEHGHVITTPSDSNWILILRGGGSICAASGHPKVDI